RRGIVVDVPAFTATTRRCSTADGAPVALMRDEPVPLFSCQAVQGKRATALLGLQLFCSARVFPAGRADGFPDPGGHFRAAAAAPGAKAGVPLELPFLGCSEGAFARAVDLQRATLADPGEVLPAVGAGHLLVWMHPRHIPGFHRGSVALFALRP